MGSEHQRRSRLVAFLSLLFGWLATRVAAGRLLLSPAPAPSAQLSSLFLPAKPGVGCQQLCAAQGLKDAFYQPYAPSGRTLLEATSVCAASPDDGDFLVGFQLRGGPAECNVPYGNETWADDAYGCLCLKATQSQGLVVPLQGSAVSAASVPTPAAVTLKLYDQCGGGGVGCSQFTCADGPYVKAGGPSCPSGSSCQRHDAYYWQCQPVLGLPATLSAAPANTAKAPPASGTTCDLTCRVGFNSPQYAQYGISAGGVSGDAVQPSDACVAFDPSLANLPYLPIGTVDAAGAVCSVVTPDGVVSTPAYSCFCIFDTALAPSVAVSASLRPPGSNGVDGTVAQGPPVALPPPTAPLSSGSVAVASIG